MERPVSINPFDWACHSLYELHIFMFPFFIGIGKWGVEKCWSRSVASGFPLLTTCRLEEWFVDLPSIRLVLGGRCKRFSI